MVFAGYNPRPSEGGSSVPLRRQERGAIGETANIKTGPVQPPFARIYEGPNVMIEAISGSTGSDLHDHRELQICLLSEYGVLEAEWLTETGQRHRKQFSGPTICVTPGSQPHSMRWSGTVRGFVVGIGANLIGDDSAITVQEAYGFFDPFLHRSINLLNESRGTETSLTRLQAEAAAVMMVEHLRSVTRNKWPAASRQSVVLPRAQLAQVLEYMDENLENDMSLGALAKVARMSVSHFTRCFKAATGMTPHFYLLERRVERAKRLLAGEASIAEIAFECGFVTQAHLTTVFHKLVGATPNTYRRSLLGILKDSGKIDKNQAEI